MGASVQRFLLQSCRCFTRVERKYGGVGGFAGASDTFHNYILLKTFATEHFFADAFRSTLYVLIFALHRRIPSFAALRSFF